MRVRDKSAELKKELGEYCRAREFVGEENQRMAVLLYDVVISINKCI